MSHHKTDKEKLRLVVDAVSGYIRDHHASISSANLTALQEFVADGTRRVHEPEPGPSPKPALVPVPVPESASINLVNQKEGVGVTGGGAVEIADEPVMDTANTKIKKKR